MGIGIFGMGIALFSCWLLASICIGLWFTLPVEQVDLALVKVLAGPSIMLADAVCTSLGSFSDSPGAAALFTAIIICPMGGLADRTRAGLNAAAGRARAIWSRCCCCSDLLEPSKEEEVASVITDDSYDSSGTVEPPLPSATQLSSSLLHLPLLFPMVYLALLAHPS
jgi:hypothetical protein